MSLRLRRQMLMHLRHRLCLQLLLRLLPVRWHRRHTIRIPDKRQEHLPEWGGRAPIQARRKAVMRRVTTGVRGTARVAEVR